MKRALPAMIIGASLACDRLDTFPIRTTDAAPAFLAPPDAGAPLVRFKPADVLFVVDDSGSMADEQANLARNFAAFADQIIGYVDYRIAVVTTDVDEPMGEYEGLSDFSFAETPPYILSGFGRGECRLAGIAHGCFRGASSATRMVSPAMTREEQIAAFEANVRVGTCGSGFERAFEAMLRALEATQGAGCNRGFLRAEANLVIIFVSDEEDDSEMPIAHYVEQLGRFKPYEQIRVAAITGSIGGRASACSVREGASCGGICATPPPAGSGAACAPGRPQQCPAGERCSPATLRCENEALRYWSQCAWCSYYDAPDCCQALPGARYLELARAVEDRVTAARGDIPDRDCLGLGTRVACLVDTICQDSFGDTMARIARELVLDAE